MTYFPKLGIKSIDPPLLDAFGRLRVSEPATIFDSKLTIDKAPAFWDESLSGGSTSVYSQTHARVRLTAPSGVSGAAIRQTFRRFNYQPGKSQLVLMTTVLGDTEGAGTATARVGLFDDDNGYLWQRDATGISVRIRKAASDPDVAYQGAWNLDNLDGTGPSGLTIDWTKTQILWVNFEWLGVGSAWFGVVNDGRIIPCHRFDHANTLTEVYASTPNLPIRYSVTSAGDTLGLTLDAICSTVITEGGRAQTGLPRGAHRGTTPLVANAASVFPVLAIRLAPTASIPGALGALVVPTSWTLLPVGGNPIAWRLMVNPTIAGTPLAWLSPPGAQSPVQYATPTNATTVSAAGTVIAAGYAGAGTAAQARADITAAASDFALGATIGGTPQELVITCQRVGTSGIDVYGAINWTETH